MNTRTLSHLSVLYARGYEIINAIIASVLVICLFSGCFVANLDMKRQVREYSGDGTIENCATFYWPGFQIQFPSFDATRPFEASYHLSHVPQLHDLMGTAPYLYLRFRWHEDSKDVDEIRKLVTASYRFQITDENGRVLESAELPFSTSTWGGSELYGVYDLDKSRVHFKRGATYILNVFYDPGTTPPPTQQLYFSIENGCTK